MRRSLFAATLIFGVVIGILCQPRFKTRKTPSLLETLGENTGTEFSLKQVIRATGGHQVLSPDPGNEDHIELQRLIIEASKLVSLAMSRDHSPARVKNRINEVSALFENALRTELDSNPDLTCTIPLTTSGASQRSGYPDLRLEHLPSGTIAYLDPKLFAADSKASTFRSFYFEPGGDNSKITEDALHFLIGFPHDGRTREWSFDHPELVDLSQLTVTLKTEFSASNKEIYSLPAKK